MEVWGARSGSSLLVTPPHFNDVADHIRQAPPVGSIRPTTPRRPPPRSCRAPVRRATVHLQSQLNLSTPMLAPFTPIHAPTLFIIRNLGFQWRDPDSRSRSTEPTGRLFDLLELITPRIDLPEGVGS